MALDWSDINPAGAACDDLEAALSRAHRPTEVAVDFKTDAPTDAPAPESAS
jgi:hypothetical protein